MARTMSRKSMNAQAIPAPPRDLRIIRPFKCISFESKESACSSLPGTESPLEICLGRSNRSRADLAGSWTTRVQARRVPADPTADRKPKACQCSPSRSHPVTGIAYRQEDRRVRLQNRGDSATASRQLHTLPGNEVSEKYHGGGLDL